MNSQKISVVLTTYNGEEYIGEQLNSILTQSRKPDEIVIMDDCSSDRTLEIVSQMVNKSDICCKLILNKQNVGWRRNFINGFHHATGDIIFCSDQDDIWHSTKLELMEKVLTENPSISVLASNLSPLYEKEATKLASFYIDNFGSDYVSKVTLTDKGLMVLRPGCTICFRKTIMNKIEKIWDDCLAHDEVIWAIGLLTDSLYIVNEPLIQFRRHANNSSPSNQKRIKPRLDRARCNKVKLQNILENAELLQVNEKQEVYLRNELSLVNIRIKAYSERNIVWLLKHTRYFTSLKTLIADILSILKG